MRKFLQISGFFFLLLGAATFVQAQSVDKILDNYYEVIGDADDWAKIKNLKMTGTAVASGMSFPMTMHQARPNKMKMEMDFQGQKLVQAFDGETAWSLNPFMGQTKPSKATDEESKASASQLTFEDELVNYKEKGHSLSLDGKEEIQGTKCYKLTLTKADDSQVIYFIDMETYAPVMYRVPMNAGPMKGQSMDNYMSDYQEVEGVMMPHSLEQKIGGQSVSKMTVEKMDVNVDLPDSFFAFPEE